MGDVLVFAEHQHGKFPKTTLVAFAAGKDAAAKFGGACHAVVVGSGVDALASEAATYGMKTVFQVDSPRLEHYLADAYTAAIQMKNALVCVKAKRPYWARKELTWSAETSDH